MYEELNKKLAEWAGFRFYDYGNSTIVFDSEENSYESPDFTDPELGIAYCFKWLVPELLSRNYYVEIIQGEVDDATCHLHTNLNKPEFLTYAKTPALALCLAIEKLMEANNV